MILFVASGLVAALAGILLAGRLGAVRGSTAKGFGLDIITMVLLGGVSIFGGVGSLWGVLLLDFVDFEFAERNGLVKHQWQRANRRDWRALDPVRAGSKHSRTSAGSHAAAARITNPDSAGWQSSFGRVNKTHPHDAHRKCNRVRMRDFGVTKKGNAKRTLDKSLRTSGVARFLAFVSGGDLFVTLKHNVFNDNQM